MRKQREITRLSLHRGGSATASTGEFLAAIDSHEDSDDDIQLMIRRNFPVEALNGAQTGGVMLSENIDRLIEEVIAVAVSAYTANQKLLGIKLDQPLTTDMPIDTELLPAHSLVRAERRLQP